MEEQHENETTNNEEELKNAEEQPEEEMEEEQEMDENEMTVDQVMNIIYDWFAGPDAKAKTTFSEWYK